jgi:hypothetical protein
LINLSYPTNVIDSWFFACLSARISYSKRLRELSYIVALGAMYISVISSLHLWTLFGSQSAQERLAYQGGSLRVGAPVVILCLFFRVLVTSHINLLKLVSY